MNNLRKSYEDNGYLIFKNFFKKKLISDIEKKNKKFVINQLQFLKINFRFNENLESLLLKLKKKSIQRYISTLTLMAKSEEVISLIYHKKLINILKKIGIKDQVYQTNPVIHLMSNKLKLKNGYHGLSAHQDWPTLQGSLETATVWFPLYRVDKKNFTLEILPKSHKFGLIKSKRKKNVFEINNTKFIKEKFLPISMKKGGIVIFSSFLVHRSGTGKSNSFRLALSMRYEESSERHFIQRSYPFAQKRYVLKDLITPNFPKPENFK